MRIKESDRAHVRFELPLDIRLMSIDGTWCTDGFLNAISEAEAEIELSAHTVDQAEFFLLLTGFGKPVFRYCRREWVRGAQIGVSFTRTDMGIEQLRKNRQNNLELASRSA
jgi:hypothetical protein